MNYLIILEMKKLKRMVKVRKFLIISFNRGGVVLPLILLILLFSSCGISTPVYIYPPIYEGSPLTFKHDYRNNQDPDFFTLCYDIYYRIYDKEDTVLESTITSDAINFFTKTNINKFISRNIDTNILYRTLKAVSNDKGLSYSPPPILPIDNSVISDQAFYINILLNNTNLASPYIETVAPYASITLPEKIYFERYISSTESKDFTIFSGTDSDVPDTLSGNKVLVAFFVISYGFSVDLYSLTSDNVLFIGTTEQLVGG